MLDSDLGYDENELKRDLQSWWREEVDGGEDDPFGRPKPPPGTIYDVVPAIDSLAVVTGLVIVEKHIGFELPPKAIGQIVRRGGYTGLDDMLNDVLPKIREFVTSQKLGFGTAAEKENVNEASTARGPIGATGLKGNGPANAWHPAEGGA